MTGAPGQPTSSPPPFSYTRWWAAVLAAAAVWAIAVPYLGPALGATLDVPASVEVVDHVVPGLVVLGAAVGLLVRDAAPGDLAWSVAAAATFLAGFWMASTHAPLLAEAAESLSAWDAALLHTSAALPVLGAGAWMLARPLLGSR